MNSKNHMQTQRCEQSALQCNIEEDAFLLPQRHMKAQMEVIPGFLV